LACPSDFKDRGSQIIDVIQADGFKISHPKTNYKTKNPTVTGVVVKNNNLALPDYFKIKTQEIHKKSLAQIQGLLLYKKRVEGTKIS